MERNTLIGIGLSVAGLAGYVAGVFIEYHGRAFSVTALMVGITLVATTHQSASRRRS